MGSTLGSIKIS